MEAPVARDLEVTRKSLSDWLGGKMPNVTDLALSQIHTPTGSGASSETLIFDAAWQEEGQRHEQGFVVRAKPTGNRFFLEDNFENQFRVMKALHDNTDVPIPKMYWFEPDESILNAPFWLMEKIEGEVPGDFPRYNEQGFVVDASIEDRRRLWTSAVKTLAKLHGADPGSLKFLDQPHRGKTGLDQQLSFWHDSYEWAAEGDRKPAVEEAWGWLLDNVPADRPSTLSWGDSRPGNMIFKNFECRAVVDWEMVSLGGPLLDLGYWLFMDDFEYVPPLEGMGTHDETVALWAQATGISTADLNWYETFAGYRLTAIMMRVRSLWKLVGQEAGADERITKFELALHQLMRRDDH